MSSRFIPPKVIAMFFTVFTNFLECVKIILAESSNEIVSVIPLNKIPFFSRDSLVNERK